jgi:hypothetical protein
MHITPEYAGLLAQVLPTLLVALLLEGRIRPDRFREWNLVAIHVELWLRILAIGGVSVSTFFCLQIFAYGPKSPLGGSAAVFYDVVINVSVVLVSFYLVIFVIRHTIQDLWAVDDLTEERRAKK